MSMSHKITRRVAGSLFLLFAIIFVTTYGLKTRGKASPLRTLAPTVTATQVDSLMIDSDSDGRTDPGDTLGYTVTITNNGTDALNSVFTGVLDGNTTLIQGSVNVSPIAVDDAAYTATGNVRITVPAASGLLVNDVDPDTSRFPNDDP